MCQNNELTLNLRLYKCDHYISTSIVCKSVLGDTVVSTVYIYIYTLIFELSEHKQDKILSCLYKASRSQQTDQVASVRSRSQGQRGDSHALTSLPKV